MQPENLLYKDDSPDSALKVIDFGLAYKKRFPEERLSETNQGTGGYMVISSIVSPTGNLMKLLMVGTRGDQRRLH